MATEGASDAASLQKDSISSQAPGTMAVRGKGRKLHWVALWPCWSTICGWRFGLLAGGESLVCSRISALKGTGAVGHRVPGEARGKVGRLVGAMVEDVGPRP
jgi:hypothetical protein